ncbi:MAG: carbon storage regulator, partial [Ktedonobacterales bacterium]|nr:carbon storage regulator [Ktedonobacterales bacterium]
MLVLRRKAGEAIILNGSITIHVLAVEGERVKLGISAPPEVVIVRSELLENGGIGIGQPGAVSGPAHREPPHPYREGEGNRPFTPSAGDETPPRREPGTYPGPSRYSARRRAYNPDGMAPAPVS